MSKYDFELDLSRNTSTGLILEKIKKGSTVLEFGCATGRMTRYMRQAMDCKVYIVEYDQSGFQKALQFAEDGICDDIQNYRWVEQFGEVAFDAIIFADVLEHLSQPEETLKKAAALLKEDGRIYVSVPNVTHNDVVLKLYEERFDYTQTGLLDDTHIHFWGLENIKKLGIGAGLHVRSIEGTDCATGNTEQGIQLGKNRLLENILRERQAGETYQFVVTLSKHGGETPVCTIHAPAMTSHIYLDTGNDFNSEEQIAVASYHSGNGSYVTHCEITDAENISRVRFDPVEYQSVILRSISISQNGEKKRIVVPNAVKTDEGIYLPGDDPMVLAQVQPQNGPVTVDAEFMLPGTEYIHTLGQIVRTKQENMDALAQQSEIEMHGLRKTISELHNDKVTLGRKITAQQQSIQSAREENDQLRTDVSAYIILTNQKEKENIYLEKKRDEYVILTEELERQRGEYICLAEERGQYIAEQGKYITELEKSLEYYRNLRVVRVRAFILRVLRKIKRCVKKILGRIHR